MIAAAILKNDHMKLKVFAGTRSRLEDDGFRALADVFRKQRSIEKLDLTQNGSKRGLAPLLSSLQECKESLRELYISDNKSINRAIPELVACIKECSKLTHLNISDLNIKCKYISQVADALLMASAEHLTHLEWNFDLEKSNS